MSDDYRKDEEAATQRRARILGMDYVDTSTLQKQLYKHLLPKEDLYSLRAVPIQADEHSILFGVTTTTPQTTMKTLTHQFLDQRVTFAIISESGYKDYLRAYDPPPKVEYHDINVNSSDTDLVRQVSETLERVRADDMLAYLVSQAHRLNASDIHLETMRDRVRIRFRIDGVLHPVAQLSIEKYRVLISAIASAGNISTSSDEAQQGHIGQRVRMADGNEVDVNVRLETAPTINGLDVVMRLFNMSQEMYQLDRLGLSQDQRAVVDDIISKPSGLVMVVGPTGSGKTTTLYSMLNSLNSEERKLITIEDPVEYQLNGISQLSVKTTESGEGKSFANRLRAVLRLDPDIVMVGEIRDNDTAHTALQAALTGHLVLSTFHASSAAAALTRLGDVIGENPLFVSAVRLVMAQRLVRRLDDATKQPYQPTGAEMQQIYEVLKDLPEGTPKPNLEGLRLYKPGSSPENPYGYNGQIAVREQFTMNGTMHEVFSQKGERLTTQQIEAAAKASGMRTMLQDAMLRVCNGETTLQEVYRVVG